MKSCLPENNVFKMVTAGRVGLTETGAGQGCWPGTPTAFLSLLQQPKCSAGSWEEEQGMYLRSFSDLGPGKAV